MLTEHPSRKAGLRGSQFSPVVYLISGMRWAFYGQSDVAPMLSAAMIGQFFLVCLGAVTYIFRSGWRLRS